MDTRNLAETIAKQTAATAMQSSLNCIKLLLEDEALGEFKAYHAQLVEKYRSKEMDPWEASDAFCDLMDSVLNR